MGYNTHFGHDEHGHNEDATYNSPSLLPFNYSYRVVYGRIPSYTSSFEGLQGLKHLRNRRVFQCCGSWGLGKGDRRKESYSSSKAILIKQSCHAHEYEGA